MKRSILIVLVICLLAGSLPVSAQAAVKVPEWMEVASDGTMTLYADKATGNFSFRDGNTVWFSSVYDESMTPVEKGAALMRLQSVFSATLINPETKKRTVVNSQACANQGKAEYSAIENGYRMEYQLSKTTMLPLEVTLEDGYVSVVIKVTEIEETMEEFVQGIQLLPLLGACGPEDEGFFLLPDGSGSLMYLNNEKTGQFNEPFYGRDKAYIKEEMLLSKELLRLPVYGIEKNGNSLLAVLHAGAGVASLCAMSSGNGSSYNSIYSNFVLRGSDEQAIAKDAAQTLWEMERNLQTDLELRLYPAGNDGYMGMADVFQTYWKKMFPREDTKTPVVTVLDVYGSMTQRKKVLGVPLWKEAVALTKFSDMEQMIEELSEYGALALNLKEWNKDGVFGKPVVDVAMSGAMGSRKQWNALVTQCGRTGTEMYLGVNPIRIEQGGNGYRLKKSIVRNLAQELSEQYRYWYASRTADFANPWYYLKPAFAVKNLKTVEREVQKLPVTGLTIEGMGDNLYSDFYKTTRISAEGTRQQFLEALDELVLPYMAEGGSFYSITTAKRVLDAPVTSSRFAVTDKEVPFYQAALSGIVQYTVPSVNLNENPKMLVLKALETGSLLKFSLIGEDPVILKGTDKEALGASGWERSKTLCKEILAVYGEDIRKVAGQKMLSHEELGDETYRTTFANGVTVTVDYKNETYEIGVAQ